MGSGRESCAELQNAMQQYNKMHLKNCLSPQRESVLILCFLCLTFTGEMVNTVAVSNANKNGTVELVPSSKQLTIAVCFTTRSWHPECTFDLP